MGVCVGVCACVGVYVCSMCVRSYVSLCMSVKLYVRTNVYGYMHMCMYYTYMYVYVYECMCVYIYTCMCTYACMRVNMYIAS